MLCSICMYTSVYMVYMDEMWKENKTEKSTIQRWNKNKKQNNKCTDTYANNAKQENIKL